MVDRLVPVLALAVVALLAICGVLSFITFSTVREARSTARAAAENTARLQRVVGRLDVGAVVQCQRVQRLRDDVNAQANNQFDVIKVAARVAPSGPARELYRVFLDSTPYSPPTNCREARTRPLSYKAPPLIPFASVDPCYSAKNPRPRPPCKR